MAFAFRLCLALLGLVSFLLSSVNGLAVDVQPAFPNEPESTSIPIPGTDENPWPAIQPIDPPDPPVPTKVPLPTSTPFIIDTRLIVKVYTGQPFIIRLDKFLQIFQDGAKVDTNPRHFSLAIDTDKHSHHNSAHNSSHDTSHNNSSHNNSSDDSSHIDDAADHLEDNSDFFTKSDLVPEREV
ncbi:hypothetical protein LA080_000370 [Diaporthe eres]|nr:hypothetical protein LA080_000370 [Diaporthe eres]